MSKNRCGILLVVLTVFFGPKLLEAQVGPNREYQRIVSVNPVALVFLGAFSVEYEQVWGVNTTWGLSGSYYDRSRWSYSSLDGKLRYYPQGRALDGIGVGILVGFSLGEDEDSPESGSAIGVGFTAENQWLLGDDERLALTVGVGGKRFFYISDLEDAPRGLPVVRLSLGWAF